MTSEYSNFLAHYGVKGQKWGVRRYQNPDGTLKKAGQRREKPESRRWKANDASRLSNEELDRRNTRLQKENQYRQNIENAHPVKKEIKNAAKKILLYSAVGVMSGIMAKNYKDGAGFIKKFNTYKLGMTASQLGEALQKKG